MFWAGCTGALATLVAIVLGLAMFNAARTALRRLLIFMSRRRHRRMLRVETELYRWIWPLAAIAGFRRQNVTGGQLIDALLRLKMCSEKHRQWTLGHCCDNHWEGVARALAHADIGSIINATAGDHLSLYRGWFGLWKYRVSAELRQWAERKKGKCHA